MCRSVSHKLIDNGELYAESLDTSNCLRRRGHKHHLAERMHQRDVIAVVRVQRIGFDWRTRLDELADAPEFFLAAALSPSGVILHPGRDIRTVPDPRHIGFRSSRCEQARIMTFQRIPDGRIYHRLNPRPEVLAQTIVLRVDEAADAELHCPVPHKMQAPQREQPERPKQLAERPTADHLRDATPYIYM